MNFIPVELGDFTPVEFGDIAFLVGDLLLTAISSANVGGRHLPSQELTSPIKILKPLLPCVFTPFLLNSACFQVSEEEKKGLLRDDLGFPQMPEGLILGALGQIYSVHPYLKRTSYFTACTYFYDLVFFFTYKITTNEMGCGYSVLSCSVVSNSLQPRGL